MIKVGKKLMICDGCNRNWKNDTLIKISLEPHKITKQTKLDFKETVLKFRRMDVDSNGEIKLQQDDTIYAGTLR